jgi:hypothetical protein
MVEELGVTNNPDHVGFYSGLVVSRTRYDNFLSTETVIGSGFFFRAIFHGVSLGQIVRVSGPDC